MRMGKGRIKTIFDRVAVRDKSAWARGAALVRQVQINHPQGNEMTGEAHDLDHHKQDDAVHERDYEGFITLLKWTIVVVAIISAAVIFIISN